MTSYNIFISDKEFSNDRMSTSKFGTRDPLIRKGAELRLLKTATTNPNIIAVITNQVEGAKSFFD
jgi:hypothetical protein